MTYNYVNESRINWGHFFVKGILVIIYKRISYLLKLTIDSMPSDIKYPNKNLWCRRSNGEYETFTFWLYKPAIKVHTFQKAEMMKMISIYSK